MSTRTFRKLTLADVPAFAEVTRNAYPGLGDLEGAAKYIKNAIEVYEPNDLYGLFEGDQVVGGLCTLRFAMNVRSVIMPTLGTGNVATDLLHKREGVAHDLITNYLGEARRQGYAMTALFPFRVDFYRKMGFGYGARVWQYRVKPAAFRTTGAHPGLVTLANTKENRQAVHACYARFVARTHGAPTKLDPSMSEFFNPDTRVVAFQQDGEVQGYLAYSVKGELTFKNHLVVEELIWETPAALNAFCTFLHNQRDQFDRVIINTPEEHLPHLLLDPAYGSFGAFDSHYIEQAVIGTGVMYRVVDLPGLFAQLAGRRIGRGSGRVKLTVSDPFFAAGGGSVVLQFTDGVVTPVAFGEYDVELSLEVGDFSSLLMGAVDLMTLHRYGLATLSDDRWLDTVAGLFQADHGPIWWNMHF